LNSIASQRYSDYEIVLTDDSRDDQVHNLVRSFHFHGRLIYHQNRKRLGSPANWNEAIRRAEGEYIKVLHHDDWFIAEDSLEKLVRSLDDNPEANLGFCSSRVWAIDTDRTWVTRVSKSNLRRIARRPESLFFGNVIGSPSATIFRRSVKEEFDDRLKWLVDLEFYIRLLRKNARIVHVPEALVCTPLGLPNQVTLECVNNRYVELYEYTYLFKKIYRRINPMLDGYFLFLARLFKKYNVTSLSDFDQLGIERPSPQPFFRHVILAARLLKLAGRFPTPLR
jgi:glycosyltransferase involved in cell wall biosynthesis